MMDNETAALRFQRTAQRLATDHNVFKKYFNLRLEIRKLRDYMVDWYAEIIISDWECSPRGKPPWHKGRWKTRGGRDQDRWRGQQGAKERSRRKCREVFRLIEFDWNYSVNMCGREYMAGSMVLVVNPDCDFVKGGES